MQRERLAWRLALPPINVQKAIVTARGTVSLQDPGTGFVRRRLGPERDDKTAQLRPSAATTGSSITSRVMGQMNASGGAARDSMSLTSPVSCNIQATRVTGDTDGVGHELPSVRKQLWGLEMARVGECDGER